MLSILSIDPGNTTGIWTPEGACQIQGYTAIKYLEGTIRKIDHEVVVIERMNLREKRTAMAVNDIQIGLDVIGCVRYFCWCTDTVLYEQWNWDKNKVSDELLIEHGMLMTPKSKWRHANDAARHALFHMMQVKKGKR